MLHRSALVLLVAASCLFVTRTARADGDIVVDPVLCPALFAAACATPGVCFDVCPLLCDGDDTTDASSACTTCITVNVYPALIACEAAHAPPAPDCSQYNLPACNGDETANDCAGDAFDGGCAEGLACLACCPAHDDGQPHNDPFGFCGVGE